MEWFTEFVEFVREHPERTRDLALAHLRLSLTALAFASLIFIPLGILLSRWNRLGSSLVGIIASLRVVPSLALIFLFYTWLGLGYRPAVLALTILAGPPLLLNTIAGLRGVDRAALEAARGLGMSGLQVFRKIQLPLALPVIIAGLRSAAVEVFASATLASFIGVKSLGQFIVTGVSLFDTSYLLAGGIPIVMMVLAAELLLGGVERVLTPPAR
jgi:osmoprotectant transport system permease protein